MVSCRPDLEPLALNDPMARRAIMDFVEADFNCSGALTADGTRRESRVPRLVPSGGLSA